MLDRELRALRTRFRKNIGAHWRVGACYHTAFYVCVGRIRLRNPYRGRSLFHLVLLLYALRPIQTALPYQQEPREPSHLLGILRTGSSPQPAVRISSQVTYSGFAMA